MMLAGSAVDLAPLLRLLGLGLLLALAPLAWVTLRSRRATPVARLQALTWLLLFLCFDLILFGAFTRLSDSGLGCPDWPGCYGRASPLGAHAEISAAQAALPSGPVTHAKAWVEMVHRYLATAVGVLIIVLTAAAWRLRRRAGPSTAVLSPWWPTFTLLWVCAQGAFGALTVTMKLFPAIVTLHLLGGVGLLVLLCIQAARQRPPVPQAALSPRARAAVWTVAALVFLQIALGAWVSTNYAVLACADFPTCQGRWWPTMDAAQGFELWRPLGATAAGETLGFAALTAIHYAHRLAAYLVLAALWLLAWWLRRTPALRRPAGWLAGLALWQLASGLSNVLLNWPLPAAVAHTGGAAALAAVLAWILTVSRRLAPQASGRARASPAVSATISPGRYAA